MQAATVAKKSRDTGHVGRVLLVNQSGERGAGDRPEGQAQAGDASLVTENHGQEKFLQSFALGDRQAVQMNSHLIPAENAHH